MRESGGWGVSCQQQVTKEIRGTEKGKRGLERGGESTVICLESQGGEGRVVVGIARLLQHSQGCVEHMLGWIRVLRC